MHWSLQTPSSSNTREDSTHGHHQMVNTEIRLIILFVAKDGESESESHSVMSDSLKPLDYTVHGILQTRILEWVAFPFSRGSSQPRDWSRSPTLQADSLSAESQGKPKNTGVGSLSLLQGIFPPQELNQGLLHCRWILHQLSYQGSPKDGEALYNQRKQDRELTVAQIMNSLSPNSDLNWRK